ncbi:predicted protein [Chaetomium globosum CBS 148.51]|uniref:Uncharacterized protein n=1 Tax=Chaetomium globosum (strain ATCC 6205 / CBS 148.51 / DSM 1962 / NBRC 6347 / NRRL 1970) TaxID=306901 RepID=Q2HGJ7_CHAGB|nr:uncharacterized protein CHGG_00657 [Chaetomium globosum CBS 148.51]EAQ92422.1 predicted protein [Chaetomium globosum CBS 148.51]
MEKSDPPHNGRRESGSPLGSDRILDRKIERLALPEGFSSNLAKRGPLSGRKTSDRSVRSIVSLFEKSAGTLESPGFNKLGLASGASDRVEVKDGKKGRGGTRMSNKDDKNVNIPTKNSKNLQHQEVQSLGTTFSMFPSSRVNYQVEDYSLTLLRHKSYFNNRPLARCLDDLADKDPKVKDQQVKSKKEGDRERAKENGETLGDRNDRERKKDRDILPNQRNTPLPLQQLDNQMGDLRIWEDVSEPEIFKLERRCSPEVRCFWNDVRTQLWVDEGEIYREKPTLTEQLGIDDDTPTPWDPATQLSISCPANTDIEHPLPLPPTRLPPPIPVASRGRSHTTISSQWKQYPVAPPLEPFLDPASDCLYWDELRPTYSVRLSRSALGCPDIVDLSPDAHTETESPNLPAPARPLPTPPITQSSHSRYPSGSGSGSGSGPWTRPPVWRTPSSLGSCSPPPVPPLPVPIPTPTGGRQRSRTNHSRYRHPPHLPEKSASTLTSVSTHSATMTNSSATSTHSRRTLGTSTSSVATRSTLTDSGTDFSSSYRPHQPRRRLTAEEKLSEIDAFLSPDREDGDREGWI